MTRSKLVTELAASAPYLGQAGAEAIPVGEKAAPRFKAGRKLHQRVNGPVR